MAQSDTTNSQAPKASASGSSSGDADLAQAYRDLARGEQAATALENNLSNLESRLDAILAALEAKEDPQPSKSTAKVKAENPSKATGTDEEKDKPQGGANGDAAKGKQDIQPE